MDEYEVKKASAEPKRKTEGRPTNPTRATRAAIRPNEHTRNKTGRNLIGVWKVKPRLSTRWEEWERRGPGWEKQRAHSQRNVKEDGRARRNWITKEKEEKTLREVTSQLKRLTNLLEVMATQGKNM